MGPLGRGHECFRWLWLEMEGSPALEDLAMTEDGLDQVPIVSMVVAVLV